MPHSLLSSSQQFAVNKMEVKMTEWDQTGTRKSFEMTIFLSLNYYPTPKENEDQAVVPPQIPHNHFLAANL